QDEQGLNSLIDIESIENDMDENNIYEEESVSLIGHILGKATYIYKTPKTLVDSMSPEEFKHSAYYIKREATFNDEQYYLLSHQPSAEEGIVGWMAASEIASRLHIFIDSDPKTVFIKGT